MGNVHMEASQVNYRGGETKMSVEEAIKAGSSYTLPIAGAETLGGVKIGSGLTINSETGVASADSQLPADPETDGVKVLTATTTSGETVKSWEDPASGTVDYSTSEVNTGVKWIDGKDIYFKVIDLGALPNATNKTVLHGITNISRWIKIVGVANNTNDGSGFSIPVVYDGNNAGSNTRMNVTSTGVFLESNTDRSSFNDCYAILYYTKTA